MTNRERADQLFAEASEIIEDMRRALQRARWNLATRRAQEVIELLVKGLLNEMGVEHPRTHDAAPLLAETLRQRHLEADQTFLDWFTVMSARLAQLRGPAFYHEIEIDEAEARAATDAAERVLAFGQNFLTRLRGAGDQGLATGDAP